LGFSEAETPGCPGLPAELTKITFYSRHIKDKDRLITGYSGRLLCHVATLSMITGVAGDNGAGIRAGDYW